MIDFYVLLWGDELNDGLEKFDVRLSVFSKVKE